MKNRTFYENGKKVRGYSSIDAENRQLRAETEIITCILCKILRTIRSHQVMMFVQQGYTWQLIRSVLDMQMQRITVFCFF